MKLPNEETPNNHLNGDDYQSDEYDQLEMIPAPITNGDFSEYMWMENEEEFDSEVMRQLEEEELMEECIVAMLNDEADEESSRTERENNSSSNNSRSLNEHTNSSVNGLTDSVNSLSISSNGVRNNGSSDFNNTHETSPSSQQQTPSSRFSVQDRLSRFRAPTGPPASNDSERKSTLNPDAKEFVPSPRSTTVTNPEAEKLPS